MEGEEIVPSGLRGARGDLAHYCRVHDARTLAQKLLVLVRAPSIWALLVYRLGRAAHFSGRRPRWVVLPLKLLYAVSAEIARHATGVHIQPWAELERDIWIESFAPVIVGAKRVRRGVRIHGGVTLGAGGPREARGVPEIGRGVVVGPGATIVGPVRVPDGSVVGPNTLLASSPAAAGAWLGVPAMRWKKDAALLVPTFPRSEPA
jgi:serine O-acetyltransferase